MLQQYDPNDDRQGERNYALNVALYRLKQGIPTPEDFKTVLEWLVRERDRVATDNLTEKDDTMTRWRQGAGQVLTDFLRYVEDSKVNAEALKNQADK